MNHDSKHSTGIFAIGTLLATDDLVADEVKSLGLDVRGRQLGWVTAEGTLNDAYRALLTTRVGDRVVWILQRGEATSADQFRDLLRTIDWNQTLYPGASIRVDITGKVAWVKDSRFAGQLVMDAIRDQASVANRPRPDYETEEPSVRLAVRFGRGQVDLGVNLNRSPLNQRGYRTEGGEAPLRETLAQVMLSRLKIDQPKPTVVIDPCCGSGTILIEACMRLSQIAPQRFRASSQLSRWTGLEKISWTELVANERLKEQEPSTRFFGFDINSDAVERARANIERAGLSQWITVDVAAIDDLTPENFALSEADHVWILANPTYGTRLSRHEDLAEPPEEIWPLLNRLTKNLRLRSKLLKKNETNCFRLYDSDLPEYNVVIDQYADYLHIQEYRPPKTVDPKRANDRRQLIRQWVPKHLGIALKHVVYKERFRQSGNSQYERNAEPLCVAVDENGMHFEVNLTTYTDVGLFLDHRPLRRWLLESCRGLRVLNLFCYTGALSVAAAKGLARSVTSIDMSKTYLTWAHRHFEINGLNPKHYQFIRANVLEWLTENPEPQFDLIILDPPTFSNTKSTEQTLDIQRDHSALIDACLQWLAPNGLMYFSNNFKGFTLDESVSERCIVKDLTRASIDLDFDRRAPHFLFKISPKTDNESV